MAGTEFKVLEPVENEIFSGKIYRTVTESPSLTWKGSRIPSDVWKAVVGFFEHVYAEEKAEAVVRLFYHTDLRVWKALPFPQKVSAASAKEDGEPVNSEAYKALMGEGYHQFGTIHSHASMSAFQSGTDVADENNAPGLHVTIGDLNSDKKSFHARLIYKGEQYKVTTADWVEPVTLMLPESLGTKAKAFLLVQYEDFALSESGEFPEAWKDTIAKPLAVSTYAGRNYSGGRSWPYDWSKTTTPAKVNGTKTTTTPASPTGAGFPARYGYDSVLDDLDPTELPIETIRLIANDVPKAVSDEVATTPEVCDLGYLTLPQGLVALENNYPGAASDVIAQLLVEHRTAIVEANEAALDEYYENIIADTAEDPEEAKKDTINAGRL